MGNLEVNVKMANELAFKILKLDKMEKDAKAEKDGLKAELTVICDGWFHEVAVDGVWMLEAAGAKVKTALNPPKCVDLKTDKALTKEERGDLAVKIGNEYCVVDIDYKGVQKKFDTDKNLKRVFTAAGVEIRQDVRYDVKAA
jgi:hypothetical protein